METLGQALILIGLLIAAVGALFLFAPHIPFIGRLPGDLSFGNAHFKVYIPLATCLLLSVVLSLVLNFLFGKK